MSLSGGKDSTAMLLKMLETGMRIDIILFCDTGLEFAEMYRHLDKLEKNIGIPITRLHPEYSFEHYLLYHKIRRKDCNKFKERYGENVQTSIPDATLLLVCQYSCLLYTSRCV